MKIQLTPDNTFCYIEIDGKWVRFDRAEEVRKQIQEAVSINVVGLNQRIGDLQMRLNWAEEENQKRRDWLSKAKQEFGKPQSISFDDIWEECLKLKREKDNL